MTPDRTNKTNPRRWPKRLAAATLILLLTGLIAQSLRPTPQEQLARIDAARAIPDDQNAALIYAQLLKGAVTSRTLDPQVASFLDPVFLHERKLSVRDLRELELPDGILDPNGEHHTLWYPWTSADYPQLRQWLDAHQDRVDKLLQAAHKPSCCFPLSPTPGQMALFDMPLGAFRQHVFILRRDANNDMAEGDIAAALTKYQAIVAMGRHLQKLPASMHFLTGAAGEAVGLHHQIEFVVTGPAKDHHLDALATHIGDLQDHWESLSRNIGHTRSIFAQTLPDHRPSKLRIQQWYRRIRYDESEWWLKDSAGVLYHRALCERRALHILIEMRRFKSRTGHWPAQLEEIAAPLPPLALADPHNSGPFVYKLTENSFRFYSTGPNAQDQGGQYNWRGPDDWPIWPRRGSANNPKQPDPNDV